MTVSEAEKVFEAWRQWFWPCHPILFSIFMSNIPESYLPYPKDVLEEALNIVAKQYHDAGEYDVLKDIQGTINMLLFYADDKDAIDHTIQRFAIPKMQDVLLGAILRHKKEYNNWLKKTDDPITST